MAARPSSSKVAVAAFLGVFAVGTAAPALAPAEVTAPRAGAAPAALVRVAPTGSDAACARRAAAPPCATLGRAYALAAPGDAVAVAAGTYPTQQVVGGPHARTGPAITFRCARAHACTIDGALVLGANNGQASGDTPSYVAFRGIDVHGNVATYYNQNDDPQSTNITFEDMHVWNLTDAGTLVGLASLDHVTLRHVEIGPGCCGGDGLEAFIPRVGAPSPSNIVVDGSTIHDIFDSCSHVPARVAQTYGACTGEGYGDGCTTCDHVDGAQWYGGNNVVWERSRIVDINATFPVGQGLFMQSANGGTFSNITVVNSVFGSTPNNTVSFSGPGSGVFGGYLHVYYNTIQGNLRLYGDPSNPVFRPGTSIVVTGNVVTDLASSDNSCTLTLADGSRLTPVYARNLILHRRCGGSDLLGAATFVNADPVTPDLRLARGSRGLSQGSTDVVPPTDIDGRRRPLRWPPDVGAFQRDTAIAVPGTSIGAARLGLSEPELESAYGQPSTSRKGPAPLARLSTYRVPGGSLVVGYDSTGHVVRLTSTSAYYTTASGLGVGADVAAASLVKRPCPGGGSLLKTAGAALEVRARTHGGKARITSITVARPRYRPCTTAGG